MLVNQVVVAIIGLKKPGLAVIYERKRVVKPFTYRIS